MAETRERLSTVLKSTQRVLAAMTAKELAPLRVAFEASMTPTGTSRTLESGQKVAGVDVDLSKLVAEAKPGSDASYALKDLYRAAMSEAGFRGGNWAAEGLHLALKEHLPALSAPADAAK